MSIMCVDINFIHNKILKLILVFWYLYIVMRKERGAFRFNYKRKLKSKFNNSLKYLISLLIQDILSL